MKILNCAVSLKMEQNHFCFVLLKEVCITNQLPSKRLRASLILLIHNNWNQVIRLWSMFMTLVHGRSLGSRSCQRRLHQQWQWAWMENILLCESFFIPGCLLPGFWLYKALNLIFCTFFAEVAKMEMYLLLKWRRWKSTTTVRGCILVNPLLHLSSALVKGMANQLKR